MLLASSSASRRAGNTNLVPAEADGSVARLHCFVQQGRLLLGAERKVLVGCQSCGTGGVGVPHRPPSLSPLELATATSLRVAKRFLRCVLKGFGARAAQQLYSSLLVCASCVLRACCVRLLCARRRARRFSGPA